VDPRKRNFNFTPKTTQSTIGKKKISVKRLFSPFKIMSHASFKNRATSTLQTCYVDLATLEGNAKRLYAGRECTTPFSRDIEKSSWFTTLWSPLKAENASADTPVWKTAKSPDFLLDVFIRGDVPTVRVKPEFAKKGYEVAWTPYFGHNWAGHVEQQFNDLKGQTFDPTYLDHHANLFTRSYDKWILYNKMVGNTEEATSFSQKLNGFSVKQPLPFTFTKSAPDALKLCCLKLVDVRFAFHLQNELGRLLRLRRPVGKERDGSVKYEYLGGDNADYVDFEGKSAKVRNIEMWGKYAMVTDEERDFHKSETHSIVLEQSLNYDHVQPQSTRPSTGTVRSRRSCSARSTRPRSGSTTTPTTPRTLTTGPRVAIRSRT
jgi:Major capsid protein N-terminus